MNFIILRIEDIKPSITDPETTLLAEIEKIQQRFADEAFNLELETFKAIKDIHILKSLGTVKGGKLCVNVYNSLRQVENDTSLEIIMRGLLPPEKKNIAETKAIEEARNLSGAVVKEIEFLMAVTKKGKTSNNVLAKFDCCEEFKANIEQFEEAKLMADTLEEEEKEEKEKAKAKSDKSENSKKSKKKDRKKSKS